MLSKNNKWHCELCGEEIKEDPHVCKDKEIKCEAKFGDKECGNIAIKTVASKGELFMLCKDCAKVEKAQKKINK